MRIASLIAVFTSTVALAQAPPYERTEVITVEGVAADELYRRAERWFVDAFADAQEVIQLRDTLTNTIVGKGSERTSFVTTGMAAIAQPYTFTYSVEVQAKEGRCRVRVYDVFLETGMPILNAACCYGDCSYAGSGKRLAERLREGQLSMCADIHARLDAIIPSAQAAFRKPSQDDW